MLRETLGEQPLSLTAVFECHSRFMVGWVSVEDDKCSGWPSTSKTTENVENIPELIQEDCHQTFHELTRRFGISYGVREG
jgi:hypothetical protein